MSTELHEKVFVIIPAYNESQDILKSVVSEIREMNYPVVVVDDGSDIPIKLEGVQTLRHVINLGYGAACLTGMTYALENDAKVIVQVDADGQHDPNEIGDFVDTIMKGDVDIALGSRFLDPVSISQIPKLRRIVLQMGRMINGMLSGIWLSDAHNGFRALNRNAAMHMKTSQSGFAYASELLTLIRNNSLKVGEVSTHVRYTDYSISKGQKNTNAFNILLDLVFK